MKKNTCIKVEFLYPEALPFPNSGMLLRGETIPDLMFGNGVQRELVRISSSLERCGVARLKKVLE